MQSVNVPPRSVWSVSGFSHNYQCEGGRDRPIEIRSFCRGSKLGIMSSECNY